MGEIKGNESKPEFVEIQNENNANLNDIMRKSRKRKRATEPVRHFKTMRLAKEVRKRNLSWNWKKVIKIELFLCRQKFEANNNIKYNVHA